MQNSEMMVHLRQVPLRTDLTTFQRRQKSIGTILAEAKRLVIFGAGQNGQMVASLLRRHGLEPAAFMDDTPAKLNTVICGLPVEQVPLTHPDVKTIAICSVFSARFGFLPIQRRLRALAVEAVSLFRISLVSRWGLSTILLLGSPRCSSG